MALEGKAMTQASERYPTKLCKEINLGLKEQLEQDKEERSKDEIDYLIGDTFYDETTGEQLDKEKVIEARAQEMRYYHRMGVYTKVPYEQAVGRTGRRPIGSKWVDIKKSDGRHRSRLVAKEFNNGVDQDMYAATPPLEALKLLVVKAAGREQSR